MLLSKNDSIPPPPQLQGKKTSIDNGYKDYDVPRSSKYGGDYDTPVPQSEIEARGGGGQRGSSGERDMDYDIPRQRREKVASMLATRHSRMSDTSSEGSRPLSNASSIYSADASSTSLPSSHSSSKVGIHQHPGGADDLSNIDQQLEMIDQLVENVAAQNSTKLHLLSTGSTGKVHRSISGGNLDEEGSSNSGSNDNLGVWDDISCGSDSDEESKYVACSLA